MSRTVTALYDTRAEAEAARQRLSSEFDLSSARIIDQASHGSGRDEGSLNRIPMSHEDRHAYGEGIRRGGFMLTAEVAGNEDADRIVRALEESAAADLDQRQEQWRRDGWSPQAQRPSARPGTGFAGASGGGSTEERIPIVEEELVLGKREVERGGARVRSYVREVPVHEQVTLRDEHVSVERHPVEQRLSPSELNSGDLLRERQVEVRAVGEEAVVEKEARVREEVVVRKTADERVQRIDDTVARTEVGFESGGSERNERDIPSPRQPALAPEQPAFGFRPAAETTHVPMPQPETPTYTAEIHEERVVKRPSRKLVIGSAVAGAVAGGVLPFMLVGRKSSTRRRAMVSDELSVDARYEPADVHYTPADDRPEPAGTRSEPAGARYEPVDDPTPGWRRS